jgi:hypothetical protein
MKKMFLTLALVSTATCVFAQGSIVYYNRIANSVVAPVYAPDSANPTLRTTGQSSIGFPTGATVYGGPLLAGTNFSATLWAGPSGASEAQLTLVPGSLRDFRTGTFAGAINNSGNTIVIPGVGETFSAALQLRVWDNAGGTITSYDAATVRGASLVFNSLPLGGGTPPPNMVGLVSFNIAVIPEPSTFVLAGLGAAALVIFRRRK